MYTFDYNGFTLANDDNHTINKVDGLSRVDIRTSSDVLTGADGGNMWEQMYDMRTIEIGGDVFGGDIATYYNLRSAMLTAFTPKISRTLTITSSDGSQYTTSAYVTAVPLFSESEGESATASYQIILRCQDPFLATTTQNSATLIPASGGGTPVASPVASPVGGTAGNIATLTNGGQVSLYPIVTFTGLGTNLTLTNTGTGESFSINTTIVSGSTITLTKNTRGLFVTNNAGVSLMQYFTGTFFALPVGTTNVSFTASGSTDANTKCVVSWNNKLLGI